MPTMERQRILEILRSQNGWLRRHELARALGKDRLSPEDALALDQLAEEGLVIQEISDDKSPQGQSVRYRFSQPK